MKTFKEGDSIEVAVAEEFELSLSALGASGYEWAVTETTPGLVLLGSVAGGTPPKDVGGPFPQRFRFRADQAGTFQVDLVHRRVFGDTTPTREITVQVIAQGRV